MPWERLGPYASARRIRPSHIVHDPEKHALGLDPTGGNRFSEKIMHRRKI
jgi:hypothetical protein